MMLRFFRLPRGKKKLLLRSMTELLGAWLSLWIFGVKKSMASISKAAQTSSTGSTPAEIVWAVRAIARRFPFMTCLVQTLACRKLLALHGYPSVIKIGVRKAPQFAAHAWLEQNHHVILGELPELHEFNVMEMEVSRGNFGGGFRR